jgi:hypothetical protein
MQSTAKSVTVYLDEVPAERKAALAKLRDLCRTSLKGFEESMRYGGPAYSRNGEGGQGRRTLRLPRTGISFPPHRQLAAPAMKGQLCARPLKVTFDTLFL